MKKWIGIVVLVLVGGAVAFVAFDRLFGAHRLESWIGRIVVGVANSYLVPDISYDEIAYAAPATVDLTKVAFTAPDGTRVIEIDAVKLTLAELPRRGKPIVVKEIVLQHGILNLIKEENGGIRGLSPLMKSKLKNEYAVEGQSKPFKLSDSLRLEKVVLDNVDIRFDNGTGRVLKLDGISIDTEITAETYHAERGWHRLDIGLNRGEALDIRLPGHLNLDTLVAAIDDGDIDLVINDETIHTLPPRLQTLLVDHKASGRFHIDVDGFIPLEHPTSGMAAIDLAIDEFDATKGDFKLPIERLDIQAGLAQGAFSVSRLTATMLDGSIEAKADIPLEDSSAHAVASWKVTQVDLAKLMAAQDPETRSKLAGLLDSEGSVQARIAELPESIDGSGALTIRKGRLLVFKFISRLAEVMNIVTTGSKSANHRADIEFRLTPAGVEIHKSEIVTDFLAARATGLINYKGMMDMEVNAGPLERIQAAIGVIGDVFAEITDRVMTYYMRGPVGDPKITVGVADIGGGNKDTQGSKTVETPPESESKEPGAATDADGSG